MHRRKHPMGLTVALAATRPVLTGRASLWGSRHRQSSQPPALLPPSAAPAHTAEPSCQAWTEHWA